MRSCTFLALLVQTSASEDIFIDDGLSLLQLRAGDNSVRHQSASPKTAQHSKVDDCPAGKMTSYYLTTGYSEMCSDTGGVRLRDSSICGAGVLGMPGSPAPACPSTDGAWPTEGCFSWSGSLYYSTCAMDGAGNDGNKADSGDGTSGQHPGVCSKCVPDPNAPPEEEDDDASATGDPHLTTNTDEHFDISLLGQVTSEQACRDLATQWGMKLGAFDTLGYGQKFSSNMGSQLAGCWTYTGGPYACMAFYGQGGDEASQLAPPSNGGTAGPRSRLDATMQAQCAPDLAPGDDASATGDPHLTTNTGNHFDVSLLGEEEACGNCASGYTCIAGSIGVSRVQQIRDLGCGGEPDMWVCTVAKAKDACDADEKCNSFAVSDKWGLNKAQLFGASDGTPNAGWTLWSLDASAPECPPDADEASAAGDPHLITNTGEHYDYTTK